MFIVEFPNDIKFMDDLDCCYEAMNQYFEHERASLSTTKWRSVCEGVDYLIDDIIDTPLPHPGAKTVDQMQQNRDAFAAHWQAFIDAVERNDVDAVGRFILDKVQNGLIKQIEYDLIAERDARQEM
jgi:hypothetical protein